jgi:chorismate synthase
MTSGESHGKALMAIVDGVPAGLSMDERFINGELARRMAGYGRGGRMKIESDTADVVGGCRKGLTIGSPVGLYIRNRDYKIEELPDVKDPRPGHADLAGVQKYGHSDARSVLERASARETAARVASGAVAKLILREFDIRVLSHIVELGGIKAETDNMDMDAIRRVAEKEGSRLRCADSEAEKRMCDLIDEAGEKGDTLGGVFEVIAENVPPGLGTYAQWDRRLDYALSGAVMSIPAVKAVSIGRGVEASRACGSQVHDPVNYHKASGMFGRDSNNAGGIEGGISNGQPVILSGYMKPIATLSDPLRTVNLDTREESRASTERSDVCAVPACGIVGEAMVALELASAFLDKFGGDSMKETRRNYGSFMEGLRDV